jgi:hypothetical protein
MKEKELLDKITDVVLAYRPPRKKKKRKKSIIAKDKEKPKGK